jgi:hypothetical protein
MSDPRFVDVEVDQRLGTVRYELEEGTLRGAAQCIDPKRQITKVPIFGRQLGRQKLKTSDREC